MTLFFWCFILADSNFGYQTEKYSAVLLCCAVLTEMATTMASLDTTTTTTATQTQTQTDEALSHSPANLPALNMLIRQDPFTMTLDANALLGCSICLLLALHFVPRALVESTILTVPLLLLIQNDYQNFLRLGPGGTPPTLAGYARLTWLRLFILRDPFSPPPCSCRTPTAGILPRQNLPYRPGPRPTVAGLAPQRQLNQHGCPRAAAALAATLSRLAAHAPARFGTNTSSVEKHGFALFARHPVNVCGNGEVCHLHHSDRSLHLNLHPDDIAEVLAKGWGQRHPLAWGREGSKGDRWWLASLRVRSPLPETFVLIYAPRGESGDRLFCHNDLTG